MVLKVIFFSIIIKTTKKIWSIEVRLWKPDKQKMAEAVVKSSKRIFILGDFNVDILRYELSDSTNNFIDTRSSNFLLPHIPLPVRIL